VATPPTLPGSLITSCYDPVFQDSCLKPLLDQADDAPVTNAMVQEAGEPFMAHRVEEPGDIGVQNVVHRGNIIFLPATVHLRGTPAQVPGGGQSMIPILVRAKASRSIVAYVM
jgi:hypothetical protein